ncbi:MAG: GntR family transcriptional regulator [Desulfobacteraceae bacterium]|nr:MAG: GntR family transcriptional regulator [Desulfobacteraceae bacterium]
MIPKKSGPRKGLTIEEVYLKIKEMIYFNKLAPGQKLIYSDLSERLGVSITPIVQALNRLENSKLVKYVPNKGYFVGEITEEEAKQLYQAREALEIYIVPMVIQNLDSKKLDEIQKAFSAHLEAYGDRFNRGLILLDSKFHLQIAEHSHNQVIYRVLKDVFEQLYLKYPPQNLSDERAKAVVVEHREILNALRKRDVQATVDVIKLHIKAGMAHVINSLKSNSDLVL